MKGKNETSTSTSVPPRHLGLAPSISDEAFATRVSGRYVVDEAGEVRTTNSKPRVLLMPTPHAMTRGDSESSNLHSDSLYDV